MNSDPKARVHDTMNLDGLGVMNRQNETEKNDETVFGYKPKLKLDNLSCGGLHIYDDVAFFSFKMNGL